MDAVHLNPAMMRDLFNRLQDYLASGEGQVEVEKRIKRYIEENLVDIHDVPLGDPVIASSIKGGDV